MCIVMNRKIINRYLIILTIFSIFNFSFIGCYSAKEISINDTDDVKVSKILLNNGTEIDFANDSLGYANLTKDEIVRYKSSSVQEIFPLSKVSKIYIDKFDLDKTFLLGLGIVAGVYALLGIALAVAMGGRSFGG